MSLAFPTIIPPTENQKKNSITRVPIEMQSGKNIDFAKGNFFQMKCFYIRDKVFV